MGNLFNKASIPFDVGMFLDEYTTAMSKIITPKQLQVKEIPHSYANKFGTQHHYLGRPIYIAKNVSYGLILENTYCVGVAMFGFPVWTTYPGLVPPLLSSQCPELIRLTTLGGLPRNTTSYFLAKCLQVLPEHWQYETGYRPSLVTSFCDTAYGFDGAIYKATNWEMFTTLKGRPTNPGASHGKWQPNSHKQNPSKILFIYRYLKKKERYADHVRNTIEGVAVEENE